MIRTRFFIGLFAASALAGCAIETSSAGTLPPLTDAVEHVSTPAPPTTDAPGDPWYARFSVPLRQHRVAIATVRDGLVDEHDPTRRGVICTAGTSIDRPMFDAAHAARDANPDWVLAVDLARWMVAACAGGAIEKVDEILPLLDDALARFDAWCSTQPAQQ